MNKSTIEWQPELTKDERQSLWRLWAFQKWADKHSLADDFDDWNYFGFSWQAIMRHYEYGITIDFCKHEDADHTWSCIVTVGRDFTFSGYGASQATALHRVALKADTLWEVG